MNDVPGERGVADRLLDQLVDGDLSASEQAELLGRLDAEPDGWRRCALAFLEAQRWRCELRAITAELAGGPFSQGQPRPLPGRARQAWGSDERTASAGRGAAGTETAVSPAQGRRGRAPNSRSILALAATFLVAFALGRLAPGVRWVGAGPNRADSRVAESVAGQGEEADRGATVRDAGPKLASPREPLPPASLQADGPSAPRDPSVSEARTGEKLELLGSPALPESLRQALERRGHHVVTTRSIVEGRSGDGRRVLLPIDHVEVHLANRVYQ